MSTAAAPLPLTLSRDQRHRLVVLLLSAALATVAISIFVYGFDYYLSPLNQRMYHPKHVFLRPSGVIGIPLGITGFACFCGIYLYAIRKRSKTLSTFGKTRNWLDVHVVLGIGAPIIITLHCGFKVHGLAGIAYWIMLAVMVSGVIGRYLYAQIPRSISAAELSIHEMGGMTEALAAELRSQNLVTMEELAPALDAIDAACVNDLPVIAALLLMFRYDVRRPFQLARIRRRYMSTPELFISLGGLRRSRNTSLESVMETVRRRSWLATKIAFLSKTQQVFHLWHVVHRPFSYSFAILAGLHIVVVVLMGYF